VPNRIIGWLYSFLSDRYTSIKLLDFENSLEKVELGIPQGSPISPILYLFYNADLLESCEDTSLSLSPTGFADDVTLIVYSRTVERNCELLEKAYKKCLKWAKTHGSRFNPEKSELIHFYKARKDLGKTEIILEGNIVKPSKSIRLLGVYMNQRLSYKAHLEVIKGRIAIILGAFRRLIQSTWGYTLEAARTLYLSVVRPVLAFGALI
jgi:hypothetical protein